MTSMMPGTGYFEFRHVHKDGTLMACPIRVNTVTGLILQCHPRCNPSDIRHLAEIARSAPNHPVDLTAWRETSQGRMLEWSARIHWRKANG